MTPTGTSDLLTKFNLIYEEHYDERDFCIDDKPCFKEVYYTLKKYHLPTDNFESNLSTLKLLCETNSGSIVYGSYNPKTNKIVYCDQGCLKHELFHVGSSSRKDLTGIVLRARNGRLIGNSLNEGITDMFSKLSNSNETVNYPFEKFCAESLIFMYGIDICKPYCNNDPFAFVDQFDQLSILELMDSLDKYSASICNVFSSLSEQGWPTADDVAKVTFSFNKTLEKLAVLFHQSKKTEKADFRRFVLNGLYEEEMQPVMDVVTRFGLDESEDYQKLF